jgi:glucan phosphoethanolaminetransferase (alkaline phosphatase superfamily)
MIQRLQSVFLALVAVAMTVCLLSTSWTKTNPATGERAQLSAFALEYSKMGSETSSTPTFYVALLAGLAAILAIYSLLQYKNRMRQMVLGLVNSLVMIALLGCLSYLSVYKGSEFFQPEVRGQYQLGFYAVVIGLISNVLANRFIRRDEQLVRSADRMR